MNYLREPMRSHKNKPVLEGLFLLLAAFLVLLFASRSSFLYPFNDWNDANSYFSVGKALFNGKMPYRDVFDQKGMYLYFLYGLAYLVSHTTFLGVFFLEVILAFFDLWGFWRILRLYVKRETALFLAPLPLAAAFSSDSFYWGGSAEEVCFPFLVWGFYLSLAYFKDKYPKEKMDWKTLFFGGLLAGMTANIKFTVLGFFFAWMMCVGFSFLAKKDLWGGIKACLVFLLGMALTFVPWVIYFGIRQGLYDWYWGYVYINVFVYSDLNGEGPGLYERVYGLSKLLYWLIRKNFIYFGFVIPGVAWQFFGRKKKMLERFHLFALCFFLFLGIYIGGAHLPYYALPLSVFGVLGFALIGKGVEWAAERFRASGWPARGGDAVSGILGSGKRFMHILPYVLSLAVSIGMVLCLSVNVSHMFEKKEDLFLFQFKKIVEQTKDPTLLNISCLDAGLYTVCDIVPTCRWFQTQTLHIEDVLRDQEQYIREGRTDYVLARDEYPAVIEERYELAAQAPWFQGELEFTYYLFRLKELSQ